MTLVDVLKVVPAIMGTVSTLVGLYTVVVAIRSHMDLYSIGISVLVTIFGASTVFLGLKCI